jgi:hypothetical protein
VCMSTCDALNTSTRRRLVPAVPAAAAAAAAAAGVPCPAVSECCDCAAAILVASLKPEPAAAACPSVPPTVGGSTRAMPLGILTCHMRWCPCQRAGRGEGDPRECGASSANQRQLLASKATSLCVEMHPSNVDDSCR